MVTQNKPPRPHQPRQATQDMDQFDTNFESSHGNFGTAGKSPLQRNEQRNFEASGELASDEALSSVSGGMHASHTDPTLHLGHGYSHKKRERICFSKEEKEAVLNYVRQGIGACSTNMRLNNLYKDAAKLLTKSSTGDSIHDAKIIKNLVKKWRVKGDERLKSAFNRINNTKGRGSQHHDKKSMDDSDHVRDDDNASLSSDKQLAPAPGTDDTRAESALSSAGMDSSRPHGLSGRIHGTTDGLSSGMDNSSMEKLSESDKIEEEAATHRACVDEQQASMLDNDGANEDMDSHHMPNVMIGESMEHRQHSMDDVMLKDHMQHSDSGTAMVNDGKDSESVNTALFDGVMRGV